MFIMPHILQLPDELIKCSNLGRWRKNRFRHRKHSWASTHSGCLVQIIHEASLPPQPPSTETKSSQIFTRRLCRGVTKRCKAALLCVKAIDGRVKLALKAFHSSGSIINIEALMDINDSAAHLERLLEWKTSSRRRELYDISHNVWRCFLHKSSNFLPALTTRMT